MSVVSFRESVALGAVESIYLEIGRPFINAGTISVFSAAALAGQVGVRVISQGQSIFPIATSGGDPQVWLENHAPVLMVINKEVNGPPYTLQLFFDNSANAGAVIVSGFFEVYNSPYPQTRIKFPPGTDKEEGNPWNDILSQWQGQPKEE